MDKKQADAVADALLEPTLIAQEERRLARLKAANDRARKQRIAWFWLGGCFCGAVISYVLGRGDVLRGAVLGGAVGGLVGALLNFRTRKRMG